MAKKQKKRVRKTRRSKQLKGTPPGPTPSAPERLAQRSLDISTTEFDRPTVKIDGEPYLMRVPDELTFSEFGRQVYIGGKIEELAKRVSGEEEIEELGKLMAESVRLLLLDVPEDVIAKLSPGLIRRIVTFFRELASADAA